MPIRKCGQLTKALDKYYRGEYFRDDLALKASVATVQALKPGTGRFLAEVCMVADWGSIPYFPFDVRVAMAAEIEACWVLLQSVSSLHTVDWDAQTELLTSAVDALSRTRLLQPTPNASKQLSFLSKYLHVCINDDFPIWDKNARTALAHPGDQATWPSYEDWIGKVRQEAKDHNSGCLDQLRLPGESLVRTLDKALYMIGQKVVSWQTQRRKRAKVGDR